MFVKVYRYKIKESDLEESRRISKDADLIYATYGRDKEPITLYKKVNDLVEVLLIEFYNSKKDYEILISKVNNDYRIKELWNSFIEFVYKTEVKEEEFETLD